MAKVLIVLTSHTTLGATGRMTGFYFDEMATPCWAFVDAGHAVEIASVAGGLAVHDPGSVKDEEHERPEAVNRFLTDADALAKLSNTRPLHGVDPSEWDAVFLPGGHGTMWDFPENDALAVLISDVYARGGVVGAVCHGPAGLLGATRPDGYSLVDGLRVNSFTDAEEAAAGLADAMPFLLESRLREQGAHFEAAANFQPHAVRDGTLVTGQNPASAEPVAALMLEALESRIDTVAAE